jgi:hypothetical protein
VGSVRYRTVRPAKYARRGRRWSLSAQTAPLHVHNRGRAPQEPKIKDLEVGGVGVDGDAQASAITAANNDLTAVPSPLARGEMNSIAAREMSCVLAGVELSRFHLVRNSLNNLTASRHLKEILFDTL